MSVKPALLLPVGGLEPVGPSCAVGIINEVTEFICSRLSDRCDILYAPLLSYAPTTAYRAFGGSIGIKKNIFESLIVNCVNDCAHWGIRTLFIFDGTFGAWGRLQDACSRIMKRRTNLVTVHAFNWQREKTIRSLIAQNIDGRELGRSEFGIMSLASYFKPFLVRPLTDAKAGKDTLDEDVHNRWKKRGEDPDKFRRLYPDCSTSYIAGGVDAQFGKALLDMVLDHYGNIINDALTDGMKDSDG